MEHKSTIQTHQGHAIKRIRESMKIKQEALALDLGMTQQSVSLYEQKKDIEEEILNKFAEALHVSVDLLKGLEEDPFTIIIENNTFGDNNKIGIGRDFDKENTYNPVENIIELTNQKTALYERMLKIEQEKIILLEKLLKDRK